jgi:8-oxo-dGTP diphosphatase
MKVKQEIRVAVDAVVFGFKNNQIYLLLVQSKFGTDKLQWALPGGLVQNNESLKDAVLRELAEETNVKINYLEQLYTFGDNIHRDHRNRVISVAYFGVVDATKIDIIADTDVEHAEWLSLDKLPKLAFDHKDIIKAAYKRLQDKLCYQPIGFDLLPKEFLFSDLENLYSLILNKEIDRRNFRKKILSFGFIDETAKIVQQTQGRPAKLFRFNKKKYDEFVKNGYHFELI